jgi:hypothetical protein
VLKKLLMVAAGTAFMALGVGEASQAATVRVFASGLDSPRGLTFDSNGALYVTEAGTGGTGSCIPGPDSSTRCYGATSAVTRIQNGSQQRVVTGLPSLANNGRDASGAQDIAFDATGRAYVLVGLGTSAATRDSNPELSDFGRLLAIDNFNPGASWTRVADVAAHEDANNPDGGEVDSNPYAFLIQGNTASVVDAGGNDLLQVALDSGNVATQAVFPERLVPFNGQNIPMESVPNSIATGPDNALYVGELTGFPFPQNAARVYRIGANNQPEVFGDGFTNIIDLAFDRDNGGMYVLEYARNSILSGDSAGALFYVNPDGNSSEITGVPLTSPTGLAIGPDGAIYVSNNGDSAGAGEILRIDNTAAVPEPTSTLGLLAVGALFVRSQLKRKQK